VITVGNNWESVVDKYQITWAIVRTDSAIAKALESIGWKTLYQDKTAIILSEP